MKNLHLLDSKRKKHFSYRSNLFVAPNKTARLILYIILFILSTKIYEIFRMLLSEKSSLFSAEWLLNMVV